MDMSITWRPQHSFSSQQGRLTPRGLQDRNIAHLQRRQDHRGKYLGNFRALKQNCLVVSTQPIWKIWSSNWDHFPRVKIKTIWNHHLENMKRKHKAKVKGGLPLLLALIFGSFGRQCWRFVLAHESDPFQTSSNGENGQKLQIASDRSARFETMQL